MNLVKTLWIYEDYTVFYSSCYLPLMYLKSEFWPIDPLLFLVLADPL